MLHSTKRTAALLGGVLVAVLVGCGTPAEKGKAEAGGTEAAAPRVVPDNPTPERVPRPDSRGCRRCSIPRTCTRPTGPE